jgi:hypothetical protein
MDPNYAGICAFTLDEFDSLFADRLDYTLEDMKKNAWMIPSANIYDLKAYIYDWYDGYNWRETRVLNPYSIF